MMGRRLTPPPLCVNGCHAGVSQICSILTLFPLSVKANRGGATRPGHIEAIDSPLSMDL